jgi:hypothetical protein
MLNVSQDTNFEIAFDSRKLARDKWDIQLGEWEALPPAPGADFKLSTQYQKYLEENKRYPDRPTDLDVAIKGLCC